MKILVYSFNDKLGDGLQKVSFLQKLKEIYPIASITYTTTKTTTLKRVLYPLLENVVDEFIEENKIQSSNNELVIKDIERKKIKFSSYFEVSLPEDEKEYIVYFYDHFGNLFSSLKKENKNIKEPLLRFGNFQNVEIKRKFETLLDNKFRLGGTRYSIPLKKNNAIIYGYFLNNEYTGFEAAIKDLNLILNKENNKENKIEDLKITVSEFFITDIELNKINFTEEEVEKIIKDNELAISLLINQL